MVSEREPRRDLLYAIAVVVLAAAFSNVARAGSVGDLPSSCRNGCGPDSWKQSDLGQFFRDALEVLLPFFQDACDAHDACYCAGTVTYCEEREDCDLNFLADLLVECPAIDLAMLVVNPLLIGVCDELASAMYGAVAAGGESHFLHESEQICVDYEDRGGSWACDDNLSEFWVSRAIDSCPQRGTSQRPFQSLPAALDVCGPGASVLILDGTYPGPLTISQPVRLEAPSRSILIGIR
jgi:hypothetical protein